MSDWDGSGPIEGPANTRCCPKHVWQVVSQFGRLKRKLVTEIGFQGMLKVPAIGNVDKKFTLSLLDRIDIKKRAIKLNNNRFIPITAADVKHYLDIPNGNKKLFGLEDRSKDEQMDFIRFGIGSLAMDTEAKNSMKAAEGIITAAYPNGMTTFQTEQFKVSFVCFCMGNLLVAKYGSNHGVKDYWGSLMEVEEISSFDFCQAVVDEIMEAARHVQKEKRSRRPVKNVSGCTLLLQVKFLDSLNLGILDIADSCAPRIQVFTQSIIDEMKIYFMMNKITIQVKPARIKSVQQAGTGRSIRDFKGKAASNSVGTYGDSVYTPISFEDQGKGLYGSAGGGSCKKKRESVNICSYVNTLKTPRSTEYLSAYGKNGAEKKLNDKQVDDLRCHNARLRLLVNNFKGDTLKKLDCSATSELSCKEVFNTNVNKLMEQVLDQVWFVTTRLHDHSSSYTSAKFIAPSVVPSAKRSFDNFDTGCESSSCAAPMRKERSRNLQKVINDITGKNLIHNLTMVDDPWTGAEEDSPVNELGYVTPQTKLKTVNIMEEQNETGLIIHDSGVAQKMIMNGLDGCLPASSYSRGDKYRTPDQLLKVVTDTPDAMAQNTDGEKFDEIMEDTYDLDMIMTDLNNDMTYSPLKKIVINPGEMAKNPWSHAVEVMVVEKEVGETLYNWLAHTKSGCLDSWWIEHSTPTMKKIAGNDFKSVFTRGYNVSVDMFDMAMRRFGQTDRNMYGYGIRKRWMHPFECDFAKKVLGGGDYLNSRSVRMQLTGKSEEYNISDCRMIVVPNLLVNTYTAYFWDMKQRTVHVVDPTFDISRASELHDLHAPIVDKLHAALEDSFNNAYVGWEVDWLNWKKNYVQPFLHGRDSNESGLLALLAMRNFNGRLYEIPQTEATLHQFTRELLYDMLKVEGNSGVVPDVYLQALD